MLFKSKSKYDYLIVGLGNPGDKYEKTRHNVGFRIIDKIADKYNAKTFKNKFEALYADCDIDGKTVMLLKPLTYMNNSGRAVSEAVRFYKIPTDNILVISDDISMAAGRLRIRANGSHGGHNGLKDIIELLGTDNIARIKVGMGEKPHADYDLADWVLSVPSKEDTLLIEKAEDSAAQAVKVILKSGLSVAMNRFNK